MASDALKLEKSIEFKTLEAMRYREACHIYAILEKFLKQNDEGHLSLIERKTQKADGEEEELDALIKMNGGSYCILELKTSIRDGEDAKRTLKQIKSRDNDFILNTEKINVTQLILLCHEDDVEKIYSQYELLKEEEEYKLLRDVAFLTWKVGEDTGSIENYEIKYYKGSQNKCSFIKKISNQKIKESLVRTIILAETRRYYFTNVKPCKPYIYSVVKSYINQKISSIIKRPSLLQETVVIGSKEDILSDFT
jgi:hypothetical protein